MPAPLVKSFADKTGKSQEEVEKLWDQAKQIAKDEGKGKNFAYVVGILKKSLGESVCCENSPNCECSDSVKAQLAGVLEARFMGSSCKSYEEFLEMELSSGPISVSTDIPSDLTPENPVKDNE